jgi:hypothetical protein
LEQTLVSGILLLVSAHQVPQVDTLLQNTISQNGQSILQTSYLEKSSADVFGQILSIFFVVLRSQETCALIFLRHGKYLYNCAIQDLHKHNIYPLFALFVLEDMLVRLKMLENSQNAGIYIQV